ncbi:MAG: radical SAM protein [Halobacteriota archaeon]|nr:radical SAM protein [Halobacteriota archaeon]
MIIFSKVLADRATVWEAIRAKEMAAKEAPDDLIRFSSEIKPVVMWNITRACNLRCKHCYLDARDAHPDELTLEEGKAFIDDLADMEIPMLIITGGEPLMGKHFFDYAFYAKEKGVRVVISTNGTVISEDVANRLKEADILYVGVSVDAASAEIHDEFRGLPGSWDRAMQGVKNAMDAGLKTGLRITINKSNWQEVPALLDLAVELGVPRFCLYHLVPTGRGEAISDWDVTKEERLQVLKHLYDKALELRDVEIEILTTDSPMDGVYILERLKEEDPERFDDVRELLKVSGGCSIGNKVANVDYLGNVNPCHFAPQERVGNIRERSFQELWNEHPCELLVQLRNKGELLKGKCGICEYKDVCGGCRQKAYHFKGDFLEEDPTCIYNPEKGCIDVSDNE